MPARSPSCETSRVRRWQTRGITLLANKLANTDLVPAQDDITASFSSTFNFYLGLDNNHGNQPIS